MDKRKKRKLLFFIVLIALVLQSAIFTVAESEEAVIQTFGKFTSTLGPGLHMKLPWPFQTATVLPVQRTQKLELGFYQDASGGYHGLDADRLMITGDMNVVNIEFFVEWKISDAQRYLFASESPELILSNMVMSSVRSVVGTKNIDETLTNGKVAIQSEVKELLRQKLEENDIGVQILDVKVNNSKPPTEEVAKAFRDVETAKQEKDTAINRAREYQQRQIPEAEALADGLLKTAEAKKENRIQEAEGERDRYLAVYSEYQRFPEITRERMYLELLQDTLPGVRLVIDESGTVQKYLPIAALEKDGE